MLQYIPSKVNIYKENKMETVVRVVGIAVVGIAAIIVLGLILSLPVMWLWNACLVAAIPGIKEIGWLQAWGILILCGLLFKNTSSSSN
jgi:hypothetical protein